MTRLNIYGERMQEDKTYLTAQGAQKIKEELAQLKGPAREQLAVRLRAAIEQGDLSENADYTAAKEEQAFLEGRILELEQVLGTALIIEDLEKDKSVVGVGDTVTIQESNYPEEKYYLVGPKEADPGNGRISHLSPFGKALMGKKIGDEVKVEAPDGQIQLRILRIE